MSSYNNTQSNEVQNGAPAPQGLSNRAYVTDGLLQQPSVGVVSVYAGLVKVKVPGVAPKGGLRGAVKEFTRAARKRFLEALASARIEPSIFITLTYPDHFPENPERWKRDLDTFLKRLKRLSQNVSGFWRMEIVQRKSGQNVGKYAPHFHLLITGKKTQLTRFRKWLSLAWFQVVSSGDDRHLAAGTEVHAIRNRRHAMYYASKYAAKCTQTEHNYTKVGRWWGTFGDLGRNAEVIFKLSKQQLIELRRVARRIKKALAARLSSRALKGFALFGMGYKCGNEDMLPEVYRLLSWLSQSYVGAT